MLLSHDPGDFKALLAELRMLMQEAQARGDLAAPNDGFVPDYWYGVATGYQDCVTRIEVLLQRSPPPAEMTPAQQALLNGLHRSIDNDNDDYPDVDSSLFLPVIHPPKD
jgi:hypothetical protein